MVLTDSVAAFYVWHKVHPTPLSPNPSEEASVTMFHLLHDQFRLNAPLGASPIGLLPSSVKVRPSPTMPIGYERWTPSPAFPPALRTAATCFEITVDPDSPAALTLYNMATNQLPHTQSHTPRHAIPTPTASSRHNPSSSPEPPATPLRHRDRE